MKAAILAEDDLPPDPKLLFDNMFALGLNSLGRLYVLGDPPSMISRRQIGPSRRSPSIVVKDPLSTLYDLMLEADAGAMLMLPFYNYYDGNHDAIREMLTHPAGVSGLSDGGAHRGMTATPRIRRSCPRIGPGILTA